MSSDLLDLTAELVEIPSVSRNESGLATRVHELLLPCEWLDVVRIGDNVVARTSHGRAHRVVIAGHLDTVPPAAGVSAYRDDSQVWGVGATDMKGGLAVMVDLARGLREPRFDLTWCFYAREEVDRHENGLRELWDRRPDLLQADVAVLGEPTDCRLEAGCQGTMRVVVHVGGIRAHTARPFTGVNAIHRLGAVMERLSSWPGREVVLEGCTYREQLQAVAVCGGVAGNVVPDSASITLNFRFAPDRTAREAENVLHGLLDDVLGARPEDSFSVVDVMEGAPPSLDHPVLAALSASTGEAPRAKVGWTDVATFWERGVPAANFGPGDPLLAHHPAEHVSGESLGRAREVLAGLLGRTG